MSLTFGERLTAIEERIEYIGYLLDILLLKTGLMDENGKWVERDEPAAGQGD